MGSNSNIGHKPVKLHFTSCSTTETHDSSNPPIILVHGMFSTSNTWNRIKCQISNRTRRKVYCIDIRNHGQSESSDEMTLNDMAADLLQFMQDQKIPRTTLVGHSLGGRVCMQFALQNPEMVEQLVVEDSSIRDDHDDLKEGLVNLAKHAQMFASQLQPHISESDAHKMMGSLMKKFGPKLGMSEKAEKLLPFYKDQKTGEFKFHFNMPVLINVLEHMEAVRVDLRGYPVYPGKSLFVQGEFSKISMENERELILKHFPQSQFEIISKSYHASHMECPEEFNRKVSSFIIS